MSNDVDTVMASIKDLLTQYTDDVSFGGEKHSEEDGTSNYLQELNVELNSQQANESRRLVDAMHRLKNDPDNFFKCITCHKPIGILRLEFIPTARRCIGCQEKLDNSRQQTGYVSRSIFAEEDTTVLELE